MPTAVLVENLTKQYRLGELHATTLREAIMGVVHWRRPSKDKDILSALKDVSFELQQGDVLGIVGRNGAGKSTLLKCISKITHPTSGRVRTFGRVGSLLEVGTGFHSELTGKENIYLNGAILGMTKKEIDAKLDAIIDFAGVEKFIDTPIKRYSSGMHLRLGFAVAAHLEPDILLVDEVLAVGDAEFQRKCLKTMDDLQHGGRTVLFVSHNLAAVENLCKRAIWIEHGEICADGDPRDVIAQYLGSFSQAEQMSYELADMPRSGCSGAIRYTGMSFLGSQGEPINVIRSGDGLTIRLNYEVLERVRHPHFGIEFYTDTGTMLSSMNTWMSGCDIPVLTPPHAGHVDLVIDRLNFMPGRYYLSLWVKTLGGQAMDLLNNCAILNMESSDFYESGRRLDRKFGLVLLPCRWDLNGVEGADDAEPAGNVIHGP